MQQTCEKCSSNFEITDTEEKQYSKWDFPLPTECPDCRFQLRLATRNELTLYSRRCDMAKDQIVAMYSQDAPFPVYSQKAWWGDYWNGDDYAQDFDFSKPFFEQWHELFLKTPKIPVFNQTSENSDYCNNSVDNKDCYLCMSVVNCQDCLYTTRCFKNKDIVSCFDVYKSEICYASINIIESYGIFFSSYIKNCSDMFHCSDCVGCQSCIGCTNLRNKNFCIFNKEVGQEEYKRVLNEVLSSAKALEELRREVGQLRSNQIIRAIHIQKSENCSGDFIDNSKNCKHCFYVKESEDCAYLNFASKLTDSIDSDFTDSTPLSLHCMAIEQCYEPIFSYLCVNSTTVFYSNLAVGCKNCFGCSSLKKMNYCILNKQYSENEYENMMTRIVEHMKKTGEWGKFFPAKYSPFCYNETVAMEHYPLSKEQALQKGYRWKEKDPKEYRPQTCQVPENIQDVEDSIINEILACKKCGRNFKIIPKELKFYKRYKLPIPRKCPDCRHAELLELRNPRKFFERNCKKCSKKIKTTLPQSRPEVVYCEDCYLKEIY